MKATLALIAVLALAGCSKPKTETVSPEDRAELIQRIERKARSLVEYRIEAHKAGASPGAGIDYESALRDLKAAEDEAEKFRIPADEIEEARRFGSAYGQAWSDYINMVPGKTGGPLPDPDDFRIKPAAE